MVPLREATRAWWAISWQTFGGPAGQIAVMQRTLVDEKRWLGPQRFLFALSYCTLLPGPEAQQVATYTGWLLNGTRGAVIAGGLFVLPGLLTLLALSAIVVAWGDTPALDAVFFGLGPAVLAVVALAVVSLARRALRGRVEVGLAIGSFLALALFGVPFPLVIAAAAIVGLLGSRINTGSPTPAPPAADAPAPLIADDALHHARPSWGYVAKVVVLCLVLWLAPLGLVIALWGPHSTLAEQGTFFSGTALITFGGAYAVLSWVAHQAVEVHGWLSADSMTRGLALAESTPGPLIMVVQYVAFLGAYGQPGDLNPWVAGVIASLLVTWVTFLPSFAFVLIGAPFVEAMRSNRSLASALAGISAAVVGVIAHLGVWFAEHTLFDRVRTIDQGPWQLSVPIADSIVWPAVALTLLAWALLALRGWPMLRTLAVCAAAGAAWALTH